MLRTAAVYSHIHITHVPLIMYVASRLNPVPWEEGRVSPPRIPTICALDVREPRSKCHQRCTVPQREIERVACVSYGTGYIHQICYSHMLTCSYDFSIKIWKNCYVVLALETHTNACRSMAHIEIYAFRLTTGKNSLLFDIYKREETEIKLGLYCARDDIHVCGFIWTYEYVFVAHWLVAAIWLRYWWWWGDEEY